MILKWRRSESTVEPALIDTTTSPTTIYLRRNVTETEKEEGNEDGSTTTYYEYDEVALSLAEYQAYQSEKARSDIDYIAMMSDIELEED